MSTLRRVGILLAVLAVVAAPAAALRGACFRDVCKPAPASHVYVPFCSLPERTRDLIAGGFQQGRSPDVVAVTAGTPVDGTSGSGLDVPWIGVRDTQRARVPIVFWAKDLSHHRVPSGTSLDRVASTVARALQLNRPPIAAHPGPQIDGIDPAGRPRLVLEIVWKGVGWSNLRAHASAWPELRTLLHEGAGTLEGSTGSLPVDPAAVLATLGTGTLPSEHGITGTLMRSPYTADLVHAWSGNDTPTEVPTLADDLDRAYGQRPLIGLVGDDVSDRGAIGGIYYVGSDSDDVVLTDPGPSNAVRAARTLLATGYGSDPAPDLLAVVMRGPVGDLDDATGRLVAMAQRRAPRSTTVVVTATGSTRADANRAVASDVVARAEAKVPGAGRAVTAAGPGGLFLRPNGSAHDVAQALLALRSPDGRRLMADAFPAFAVSLARFC